MAIFTQPITYAATSQPDGQTRLTRPRTANNYVGSSFYTPDQWQWIKAQGGVSPPTPGYAGRFAPNPAGSPTPLGVMSRYTMDQFGAMQVTRLQNTGLGWDDMGGPRAAVVPVVSVQ
jgi:hypothetical protein